MIAVGEETGDLDKMLLKIADNFDEQVDVLVGSLMSMLEPIMVVGSGKYGYDYRSCDFHADDFDYYKLKQSG